MNMTRSESAGSAKTIDEATATSPWPLETEVHNEQERFRALFENSIDAVLLINGEGTIEAANPEARQLFNRTEEEIFQLNWTELLDSTDNRLKSLLTER